MRVPVRIGKSPAAAAALVASLGLGSCGDEGPAAPRVPFEFTDVTAESGLDMTLTSGREPATQILEVKGGGLALFDLEGDGDLDVFVPNGATLDAIDAGPGARVFENTGELRFADATERTGLALRRWGYGAAVGDFDGDASDDLFVACFGVNALLANRAGQLVDTSEASGLGTAGWHSSGAVGDLDADGDLDLYVTGYLVFDPAAPPPAMDFMGVEVFGGPLGLEAERDRAFANDGAGVFTEITESAGFAAATPSFGLSSVILDLDWDGNQDVYVGNDSQRNFFFRGDGTGSFADAAFEAGLASNADGHDQATMGLAVGDVNGDGVADLFTTNFAADTNTLFVSRGAGRWGDRTQSYGLGAVSRTFLGWSSMFYDLDQDGDEDLLTVNGHVYPAAMTDKLGHERLQPPLLFEREEQRFQRVEPRAGSWLGARHVDRGAVFGDLDGDGDIDLVVSELNGPLRLLRNDGASGNWLIVELRDGRRESRNPRALGAVIELRAGAASQVRWIFSGGGYQSASAPYAHFGLAPDTDEVDLVITWPDGARQELLGVETGQHRIVERDDT